MFAYNNNKHSNSGFLSFFANYGFHLCVLHLSNDSSNKTANVDSKIMQEIHNKIFTNLLKATTEHKHFALRNENLQISM